MEEERNLKSGKITTQSTITYKRQFNQNDYSLRSNLQQTNQACHRRVHHLERPLFKAPHAILDSILENDNRFVHQ